jgi:hypothetical protein
MYAKEITDIINAIEYECKRRGINFAEMSVIDGNQVDKNLFITIFENLKTITSLKDLFIEQGSHCLENDI